MTIFAPKPNKMPTVSQFKSCPDLLSKRSVLDFWQWAFSDLMQNTTRGALAEYIVAVLLGIDGTPRNPWESFDLKLLNGKTIEIKTMSRLQAWTQKKLSEPRVVLSPKRYWDPKTGVMEKTPSLNADLYIFCYFKAEEHDAADTLDLNQWNFFVLSKSKVNEILKKSKSVSLKNLAALGIKPLTANQINSEIQSLAGK